MPITLNRKVRFTNADWCYSTTNYTEYLFGSIGLKVNAEIWIEIAWVTEDVSMTFLASDDSVERLDGGSFLADGFRAGDTIVILGSLLNFGPYTIASVTDEFIFVTTGFIDEAAATSTIYGTTPITSIDFYPNLIENDTDFSLWNLTDRETEPHYYIDGGIQIDIPTPMLIGNNSHGWVTPADSATIYKDSSSTATNQVFVINHTFTITPIFLADQLQNLKDGLPPAVDYFRDGRALKYVYTIDGKFTAFDPDIVHTTDGNVEFPKGQTAWFNEFINGRPTTYTKESLLYFDNATGEGLTAIDYCKVNDIQARLISSSPAGTRYLLYVMYLPQNESEYVNTSTDYKTNFILERAKVSIGGGTIQGENTGDYHFLKNVTATAITANRTQIDFQVDFGTVLTALFDCKDPDNLNYLIFVIPQGCTNGAIDCDGDAFIDCDSILDTNMTSLIMDVNVYECDKDDPTLFQIIDEVQFFEYPNCDGCGYSGFCLFPMDTILVKAQFHVKQGTEINPIVLKKISASIIAVRQNNIEEVVLESFEINTSGFLPNCENIQEIVFSQERDFILPHTDCRNEIKLSRMPTLDITVAGDGDLGAGGYSLSAYELIYPFKIRWEEWRALQPAHKCFPTPTQNWLIYDNEPGWSIKFSIKATVEKQFPPTECLFTNPIITDFEHIIWGEIKDPCELPYSVEFNTFDVTGANTYEEIIAKDADTFVEATITGDFSGYTEDQLYGILTLDAWGVGGVAYSQEIGTRIETDPNSVWYGTGTTLKATLTKVSANTVKLSAYIDHRYLPTDTNQFILSARIGQVIDCGSSGNCLNQIIIDSFTCAELQIIEVIDANTLVVSGEVVTQEMRSVFIDEMIIVFITPTTWTIVGGFINGNEIFDGIVGGNIIAAPAHPYTDNNVGDTIQGDVIGTIYSGESCEDLRQFEDLENHLWDDGEQAAFE